LGILPKSVGQARPAKLLAACGASRLLILCALPAEVAGRAVVMTCHLPVSTLAQHMLRYRLQACKLLIVFEVPGIVTFLQTMRILLVVQLIELGTDARLYVFLSGKRHPAQGTNDRNEYYSHVLLAVAVVVMK
jgi:hypothetical protein